MGEPPTSAGHAPRRGSGRPARLSKDGGAEARRRLVDRQAKRLSTLLNAIDGRHAFYTRKLEAAGIAPDRLTFPDDFSRVPFTTKAELVADQDAHPPWGTALTEPIERYTRYCQTSSTSGGRPLRWIDTRESWQWVIDCWKEVYAAARVEPRDRVFFPFSFGPFLGFWAAFDAGCQLGLHAVPGGGMSSAQRLAMIESVGATVVCCTPTYALHLADVAAETRGPHALAAGTVRLVIVAGEPGGSIPATRERIEGSWGARVIDHHGLTEVGPISFECWEAPGFMHLNEAEYICEVLEPGGGEAVADGEPGELVITNLGRTASPVIRYRTGDLVVRRLEPCACGRPWARLEGGIRARADDMTTIRGVNVYPAAIEAVVRRFAEIVEFRSRVTQAGAMRGLTVEIEPAPDAADPVALAERLAGELRHALGLTVAVQPVASGSLPRFELKARRFVVEG